MQTIQVDPIITEVRTIRDKYAAQFDYDMGRMFRDLRARQKVSDRKYACSPARRPSTDAAVGWVEATENSTGENGVPPDQSRSASDQEDHRSAPRAR